LTHSHTFCSKSCGFDPTPNLNNRWWYWREGRSGFGRFETDDEGLFFMRGQPFSVSHAQARKRARAKSKSEATTDVFESGSEAGR
jgi:hypothetical protein